MFCRINGCIFYWDASTDDAAITLALNIAGSEAGFVDLMNKEAKRLGMNRQWLHARSLAFAHPADGRRLEISSPYPADLQRALEKLGSGS